MPRHTPDCPKCGQPMRYDDSEIAHQLEWPEWVCDPCDDKAISHANRRAEWDHFHS